MSSININIGNPQGPAGANGTDGEDGEIPSKSYAEFLSDATSQDTIIIYSGSYSVPNNSTVDAELRGVTRQWRGGKFVRDDTATVDGGVVIQNNAGVKYVREWDGVNIVPEFYRVGFSSSFRNDVDCINAAAAQLTNGGDVNLQYGKNYWGKQIDLRFGTTLSSGTVKRPQLASSLLTSQANAGATTVTVADGSKFRAGMNVQIASGVGYADTASGNSSYYIVSNVVGNVVTLHVPTTNTMPIGAVLFEHSYQLACAQEVAVNTDANITISGVTFDGNYAQNNHTQSWTLNNGAHFGSYYQQIRFINCTFKNQPSECITIAGKAWISRCVFKDVYGSCVHGSAANVDGSKDVWIENCVAENVCLSTAAVNGHGPFLGFYSQSNLTQSITIKGNRIRNMPNGYIISHLTPGMNIEENTVTDALGVHADIFAVGARHDVSVIGNVLTNVSALAAGGVGDSLSLDGYTFSDNRCLNLGITLVGLQDAVFTNNTLRYDASYEENRAVSSNAAVYIGGKVRCSNNTFIQEVPASTALTQGILIQAYSTYRPETVVENNTFVGFRTSIETNANSQLDQWLGSVVISKNTITVPTISGTRRGIISFVSGAKISGNTVVATSSSGAIGIFAKGVDTDTTATLIAGEVTNNTVMGCAVWLETSWYDNVIAGNVFEGVASHNTSAARQREGINYQITVDGGGNRVAFGSTIGPLSAAYLRSSVWGGFLQQDAADGWMAINSSGNFMPYKGSRVIITTPIADSSAPINCLYPSSTNGKLSWKDALGVVNPLY